LALERVVLGLGGFVLLLILETLCPFRRLVESRWHRYVINVFIAGSNALVLNVVLGGTIMAAYALVEERHLGLLHQLGVGPWGNVILTVIALDGFTYWWHRAYHGVPVMWRMHRVHHSDRDLDVTTSGRFHLTEMILSAIVRFGIVVLWGPLVAAVVIFEIVFGLFNQLEHANLQLPERLDAWLRWVVVTPAMHRVHHSQVPEHTNANYSTIFSWWDRMFGTYRVVTEQRAIVIGLPQYPQPGDVTFGKVLAMPFGPSCQARSQLDGRRLPSPLIA